MLAEERVEAEEEEREEEKEEGEAMAPKLVDETNRGTLPTLVLLRWIMLPCPALFLHPLPPPFLLPTLPNRSHHRPPPTVPLHLILPQPRLSVMTGLPFRRTARLPLPNSSGLIRCDK